MANERIDWLDELKGFGMCCVILSHMMIPRTLVQAIFSFHMPLFFFCSGYLYSGNLSGKWCLKKLDSLLIPYVIYSLLAVLIRPFWYGESICSLLLGPLKGNGLGFTWFFMALLLSEMLGALIVRITCGRTIHMMVAVIVCGIGGYLYERLGWPCVCMSGILLQATALWLIGYFFKEKNVYQAILRSGVIIRIIVISAFAIMASLFIVQRVDMSSIRTGNPFLFYGTSISFIALLALACMVVSYKSNLLTYIGKNSLLFLAGSQFIPLTLVKVLECQGVMVNENIVFKIVERIMALVLVFVFVYVANRYCSLLCGRVRLFSRFAKENE